MMLVILKMKMFNIGLVINMNLHDLFGKKDFDDLKIGECIEVSMKATGIDERGDVMLVCRTKDDTIKMKSGLMFEEDEDLGMEITMKKRPIKKGDFKK